MPAMPMVGNVDKKRTKDGFTHSRNIPLQIIDGVFKERCTLLKYIEANNPQKTLVLFSENTSLELKHLLTTSIVAGTTTNSIIIQTEVSYTRRESLNVIVENVIKEMCTSEGSDKSVLSQGYQNDPRRVPDLLQLTTLYPNSMVQYVKSKVWRQLHSRIGDQLMLYLLKKLFLFVKTNSSCFFQVSGQPINQLITWETKRSRKKKTLQLYNEPVEPVKKKKKLQETEQMSRKRKLSSPLNDLKRLKKEQCISKGVLPYKQETNCKKKGKENVMARKSIFLKRNFLYSNEFLNPAEHVKHLVRAGARALALLIFHGIHPEPTTKPRKQKRLPKKLVPWENRLQRFLKQHNSCPFLYLLNTHCPGNKEELKHITYSQIYSFCRAVLKKVVPHELWGSKRNMKKLLANLWKFISARKLEKFTLHQLMKGIKINDYQFLKKKRQRGLPSHFSSSEFLARQELVSRFYLWLMDSYLTPLLKNCFYITESAINRKRLFFFRKADWQKVRLEQEKELLESVLEEIPKAEAGKLVENDKSLGFSTLRFVPKKTGLRPLVNVKVQHRDILNVLTYERNANPKNFGATCLGYDDIFKKLLPFAVRYRTFKEKPPLYFVHVDVATCFDSIKQEKLLEILENLLSEDEYLLRKYWVIKERQDNAVYKNFKQEVVPADDNRKFPKFARDSLKNTNIRNAILVDQVKYKSIRKEDFIRLLTKHLTCNIVRVSGKYYRQKCGISQGSVASPILCNAYLGHLETNTFSYILSDDNSLLLRWMDDFLLLTHCLDYAKQFLSTMLNGFPEYNCHIKAEKSLVNFEAYFPTGKQVPRLPDGAIWFPWCSILISIRTLEVQVDYSRYKGKYGMKDSLTVNLVNNPGSSMFVQLTNVLLFKLHNLFLSLELNSTETVEINIFQSFLFIVWRFHAHVTELPTGNVKNNTTFFLKGLMGIASSYFKKVRRVTHEAFSHDDISCLFVEATLSVLERKPCRYKGLIEHLHEQRKKYPRKIKEWASGIAKVGVVEEFFEFC